MGGSLLVYQLDAVALAVPVLVTASEPVPNRVESRRLVFRKRLDGRRRADGIENFRQVDGLALDYERAQTSCKRLNGLLIGARMVLDVDVTRLGYAHRHLWISVTLDVSAFDQRMGFHPAGTYNEAFDNPLSREAVCLALFLCQGRSSFGGPF